MKSAPFPRPGLRLSALAVLGEYQTRLRAAQLLIMPSKSQLVIEYGYRVREECPDTWVFWVFAGSPGRFEQDFRQIADLVQIPGRDDPQADISKLVYYWLHNARNGKWLIIIDNADDAQIFHKSGSAGQETQAPSRNSQFSQPLAWFLPQTENGRILMTTRYRDIALNLVEERDIIAVEPMDEGDALDLLEKKIKGLTDRHSDGNTKELVAALEYMPLAIAQAAAYIVHRNLSSPIQNYLAQFRKSDSNRIKLLEREGGRHRRDWEAKHSILITWQISFDHLRRIRQSAADRLSLMSFFDRQGIPKALIREQTYANLTYANLTCSSSEEIEVNNRADSASDSVSESSKEDDFEDDMLTLRNYSFVSLNKKKGFEMHALVQLATRKWLAEKDKIVGFKRQFFRILARAFPADGLDDDNTKPFQLLFPHAKAALMQRPQTGALSNEAQALSDFATVMHNAGSYAKFITLNTFDAESLLKTAMEVRFKILDMKGMDTKKNKIDAMSSMGRLAMTYCDQGQWSEAEKLGSGVVAKSQSEFGLKHRFTLHHMNSLAHIYENQGRLDEAEKIFLEILRTMDEVSKPMVRESMHTQNYLAIVYTKQGKLEEALTIQARLAKLSEEELGSAHDDTLHYMNRMAETLQELGRLKEAINMQTQITQIHERIHGARHPATLSNRFFLDSHLLFQGEIEKAIKQLKHLLPLVIEVHGQDYALTIQIMVMIAVAWRILSRFDEAEKLLSQALDICKRGETDQETTLIAMQILVQNLHLQGRNTKAEEFALQLLERQTKAFGLDHPDTKETMNLLASIQKDLEARNEVKTRNTNLPQSGEVGQYRRKRPLGNDGHGDDWDASDRIKRLKIEP